MSELLDDHVVVATDKYEIWDNTQRARYLLIVFWVIVSVTVIAIVTSFQELAMLKKMQSGILVTDEEAATSDLIQGIIGLVQTALYIVSVVVFLNWFRRAYGNLHRLGISGLAHKENMALWSWFIPIISLFRPVQIMNEIWTKTQERIRNFDVTYVIKYGGIIIGLWWTLFICTNIIGRLIFNSVMDAETIEELIYGSQLVLVSDALQVPEALLVIGIVFQIAKMEKKLAKEIKQAGGTIVYNVQK